MKSQNYSTARVILENEVKIYNESCDNAVTRISIFLVLLNVVNVLVIFM